MRKSYHVQHLIGRLLVSPSVSYKMYGPYLNLQTYCTDIWKCRLIWSNSPQFGQTLCKVVFKFLLSEILRYLFKGQIITKRFLVSSISCKIRTNEFDSTTVILFFVCFLEEIEDIKKTFWNYLTFTRQQLLEEKYHERSNAIL